MNERQQPIWVFLDGAASFSLSMLVCLIIQSNQIFAEIWGIHYIKKLTHQDDGLMAAAFLLLCPATGLLYGGTKMFFAAREAVRRKAHERDERMRAEGLEQGLEQGLERGLEQGLERGLEQGLERGLEQGSEQTRLRILSVLERYGVELPPDAKDELANGAHSKPGE